VSLESGKGDNFRSWETGSWEIGSWETESWETGCDVGSANVPGLLDSGGENTESIVQRPLGLA